MPSLLLSFWNNYMLHSPWLLQSGFWISCGRALNHRTLLWPDHAYFKTSEGVISVPFKRMIWEAKGCSLETMAFYAGGIFRILKMLYRCLYFHPHVTKTEQGTASILSAGSALRLKLMDTVDILLFALRNDFFFIWSEKLDLIPSSSSSRLENLGFRLQSKILGWDLKK